MLANDHRPNEVVTPHKLLFISNITPTRLFHTVTRLNHHWPASFYIILIAYFIKTIFLYFNSYNKIQSKYTDNETKKYFLDKCVPIICEFQVFGILVYK